MKINHIGYLTSDLQKTAEEFEKLGYQAVSETTHDTIRLVDICFMQMDSYMIELVAPYHENSSVSGLLKKHKNMPYHICYETDSFDRELEFLEANGYTRIEDPSPAPALGGRNVCFLMNSKAGMAELLESSTAAQKKNSLKSDIHNFAGGAE